VHLIGKVLRKVDTNVDDTCCTIVLSRFQRRYGATSLGVFTVHSILIPFFGFYVEIICSIGGTGVTLLISAWPRRIASQPP